MTQTTNHWSLEIVRGRDVGRTYSVRSGESLLGNALNGEPGLDLADQEGSSPRKMASKQARLESTERGLSVRDLESPGGTFVNRQRLLPGQNRALQAGDVIQLGAVQLKVVTGSASAPSPPPAAPRPVSPTPPPLPRPEPVKTGPIPSPFTSSSGITCRTWDDFLTQAAQRWPALREELVTGRLGAWLATIQRSDLIPSPSAPGSPDERLDDWLGRLPTTRVSKPELEVHPASLVVRVAPGGGSTRRAVQLTNVGYRLLRSTVRVEPASANWLGVPPEYRRGPFVTVEASEVPIEIQIPEILTQPLTGALVVESNGGTRRVEVRLERPPGQDVIPEPSEAVATGGITLRDIIEVYPPAQRFVFAIVGAVVLRCGAMAAGLFSEGSASGVSLRTTGVLFALVGALLAARAARRGGESRDVPPALFAGAFAGVLVAAVVIAICSAVEPIVFGSMSRTLWLSAALWVVLGACFAGVSLVVVPPRTTQEDS